MSFPIEAVRLNSLSIFIFDTKISHSLDMAKQKQKKRVFFLQEDSFSLYNSLLSYFTLATIALKASGWLTAKSANTLRLISIPALCKAPIRRE